MTKLALIFIFIWIAIDNYCVTNILIGTPTTTWPPPSGYAAPAGVPGYAGPSWVPGYAGPSGSAPPWSYEGPSGYGASSSRPRMTPGNINVPSFTLLWKYE